MSGFLKAWFIIGDFLLLNLSILLSLNLSGPGIEGNSSNIYLLIFSNLSWFFLAMVSNPYNVSRVWSVSRIVKSQLAFVFVHLLVVVSLVIFFRQNYSFFLLTLLYTIFILTFLIYRVVTFYVRKIMTDELLVKNYVIIGRNELANEVRKFFLMNPDIGYKFGGYLDLDENNFSVPTIQAFCAERDVHEIYCCLTMGENEMRDLINFGLDSLIKVKVISNPAAAQQSIRLEQYDQLPGIDSVTIHLDDPINQFVKRVFDLVFSFLFTVLVMSWLVPFIGLLIKIDSRGPIFFIQQRSGKGNRPFKCLKFRTMKVNAEADVQQASKRDPRITKLGHFLRKTSIDELPQFLNVLQGSMSIVGPRPHMLRHTEEYGKLIEKFMGRHYVKPGITGLAQCLGYRGETKDLVDMENRVRMDRYYIENWTFWFDIKIIFLTVISLLRGSDKAY